MSENEDILTSCTLLSFAYLALSTLHLLLGIKGSHVLTPPVCDYHRFLEFKKQIKIVESRFS